MVNLLEMTRVENEERENSWPYPNGSEAVTLRDGTAMTIRPICPDDAPRLQAFFNRLSPETIFFRFLGIRKELSCQQAERLANVDNQTQVALVATCEEYGEEKIVAVARYWVIPADEPELAEPAIVVEDQFQNRGLGTLLLEQLAEHARAHGIRTFQATFHHNNVRITRIVQHSGLRTKSKTESGIREIRVDLETEPDH